MTSRTKNQALFGVPENSMVFARGVRKSFGRTEGLKGIDLNVQAGSVACILGPSGSGKSTFLRCINHLEQVHGGVLLVDGEFIGYDYRDGKLYEVKNNLLCRRRAELRLPFNY